MREILFRGKRIDNGKWIEGAYCKHDTVKICFSSDDPKTKHLIITDGFCDWGFEPPLTGYEVDPSTVGQYTGLKDRNGNGKRIFEGDIVEHHAQGNIVVNRGVVNWDVKNARWAHQLTTMNPDFTFYKPDAYEVIGNIHDNPELLEAR